MNKDEALKLALEALGKAKRQIVNANVAPHGCISDAIAAIEEALAQAKQPEPKPDVVELHNVVIWGRTSTTIPNIKLTFDGETGELKSAEVI